MKSIKKTTRPKITEHDMSPPLKVNLHICEHCNYHCAHCFAKFEGEKMLHLDDWKKIVDNIADDKEMKKVTEINIAGGEPMLYPKLSELVQYITIKGLDVSMVTNGSCMTEKWIKENGKYFKTIGFSIDSLDPKRQRQIGRCTASGNCLSAKDFSKKIALLREVNTEINIKVNTVVTLLNKDDCIAKQIKLLGADRWKILKMTPFNNGKHSNFKIQISDEEFTAYLERSLTIFDLEYQSDKIIYQSGNMDIIAERELRSGYIMVGSNGYLLDDTKNSSYSPVCSCLTENFSEGLKQLTFSMDLYRSRYRK